MPEFKLAVLLKGTKKPNLELELVQCSSGVFRLKNLSDHEALSNTLIDFMAEHEKLTKDSSGSERSPKNNSSSRTSLSPLPEEHMIFTQNDICELSALEKVSLDPFETPRTSRKNLFDMEQISEPAFPTNATAGSPPVEKEERKRRGKIPKHIDSKTFFAGAERMADGFWYKGEYNREGQRHGQGECIMPNPCFRRRAAYNGEFKNNKFHGKGTFYPGDGSYIEANWVNNQVEGVAAKVKAGVYSYVGEFKNEKFCGFGQLNFEPENLHYIGEFQDNKFHGIGNLLCKNSGNKMIGTYENGVFKKGECQGLEGYVSKGFFTEDFCLHGPGIIQMPDGLVIEANFENGRPEGGRVRCRDQFDNVRVGVLVGRTFFPKD